MKAKSKSYLKLDSQHAPCQGHTEGILEQHIAVERNFQDLANHNLMIPEKQHQVDRDAVNNPGTSSNGNR